MSLIAAPARPGNWLDTDQPLSPAVLADVAAAGYEGVWRYVPLPSGAGSILDISQGELARICATKRPDGLGLQCGLIQHPRLPRNNNLTLHDPEADARAALDRCRTVLYPPGCHVGLDYEGLKGDAGELATVNTRDVCAEWAGFWQQVVREADYLALMYGGYDVPLDADDLYMLPGFNQYWRGLGGVEVGTRGCSMRQSSAVVIHGVKFDRNVLAPDRMGDVPMVATAA